MAQQLTQVTTASNDIRRLFQLNASRMLKGAPKGLDPNRLLSTAFNAIVYNPDLLQCTRESLIGGAFEAVKLGLTLGGPLQEAWLIPFNNRRKNPGTGQWETVKEATFIIGYQGMRILIDRSKAVLDLQPRAVHNGQVARIVWEKKFEKEVPKVTGFDPGTPDEFDYWFGTNGQIRHRPKNAQPDFKEQLAAVYVIARLRGGGEQFDVLLPDEIEAHRARSRAKDNGPWVTDYVPMAMKTAVRKIAKYLPKSSIEIARALELDNKADAGENQDFDTNGFEFPVETQGALPQPSSKLEDLKGQMRTAEPVAAPLTDTDINFQ